MPKKEITNEDLFGLIKTLAKKDDIDELAEITNESFSKLEIKIDKRFGEVNEELSKIKIKVANLEENTKGLATKKELTEKTDKILNAVDKYAKDVKDVKTEQVSNLAAHKRMQKEINQVKKHVGLKTTAPA